MSEQDSTRLTVSILTCNRAPILSDLLNDLKRQNIRPQPEIIVVDNHSSDGTGEMVRQSFPEVVYIRLPENKGCSGRNVGMARARGDIVVTLDDDVFLNSADELVKIVDIFNRRPDVHVVNFKVLDYETKKLIPFNWYHPKPYEKNSGKTFDTDYISEGAVAFRKSVFAKAGYYPEDYFISHEGYDLVYRLLGEGYRIIYTGDIEVLHQCSPAQRTPWRNAYYDTRNYIWLIVKYYPFLSLLGHIPYRLLTTFLFSLRRGQLGWYFRAVWDAFRGIPSQWRKRKVMNRQTQNRLKEIRREMPGFFYRVSHFFRRTSWANERI